MSQFVFNGSSRMRNVTFARDHHKTRTSIIEDAQRQRQRREEEQRRTRAAQKVQRAARQWLARMRVVGLALARVAALPQEVQALLSPSPQSTTDQMTASIAALLHGACWSMAFAVRHSSCIPQHGLPLLHHVTSDTADEENPQGGAATPRTLGHSIITLEQLSAYQQATLRRYGSLLCSALRRCAHHVPNPDTEAPSQGVSLLWQQLLALASTRHTSLLLYVLLQEVAARQDGSAKAGDALAMASAGQDSAVVASVVETIVHQNKAFSSTLNEEDHAPVQPHATHHQPPPPDSPYRHHHDHRGGGAGACYSLEASSPAHVDRWPAVQALCMALELSCQEPALSNADTRAELAAVLQPLVAVFPSPPPPSPSACSAHDAGGGAALLPSAFALACWRCLCANYAGDEYQMLTADPLATLLCAEAAQDAQDATGGRDGCCAVMLDECYRRTAADARLLPGSEVNGVRGGELRARVLGRMVRLMPQVHALVQSSAPYAAVLVQRYLLSVSCLSERLCREAFFIESILADHYAYNTGRRAAAAAAATSATTATTTTAAIATQSSTTPAAGHGASRSHYRLLSSYLFSAEGGLRLLQLLTAQDEAREQLRLRASREPTVEAPTETAALSADALSAPSAGDHGAEQPHGDPSITAQAASASPSSSSATAPAPAAPSSPSAVWSTSASAQQSPLEVLCNIFAWPLFTFSKPDYARYQQETLALCAKLVRTPQLLRRLWSLYWQSCEGLRAVLPPGPALQKLCARPVWSEQEAAGAAAAPARERAEGRRVPSAAAAASTPLLAALPRLPTWETHPRYPMCFYDPHPSLSIFLFTLLAHYVNVCDFADELRRGNGAVLSCEEACALILALKEIVHRAHLYGVVPDSNGEAVAHAACLLLARLHTVNEADGFVPPGGEGLWMSVGMVAAENAVGAIVSRWDEASAAVVAEETADSEADGPAAAAGETAARERGLAQGSTGSAAAAAAADAAVLARLPGDDVMFRDSRNWDTKARFIRLLVHAPFLVPFPARALLLSALLAAQEERWAPPPERPVVVHRGRIFLDAFTLFHDNPMSSNVYNIRFVSPDGSLEAGYGRGVYRECIVSLCKEGFAAEYGLFRQTTDGYVFPNSFSAIATSDPQHLQKIRFLGAMVGRALRDGVLQDVPFALHFRNALLGRRNSLSNLKSFDAELYHQLMSLTQLSEEELEAVGLTFVYTVNSLGVTREVELVRGGAQMEVTPRNCLYYVHLVADFKLNREAAEQTRAFCDGLHGVLDLNRLRLFDSVEVGKLFGGDESGAIDLQDWKENTVYDRPEDAKQPQVRLFWDVVESLTRKQQSLLLKFVTSMTRPPLLGFSFLSPPFKLQLLTSTVSGSDHLPSAATCFSTLKLPPYTDYATARAKIVAAIEETGTFEFS